MGKKIELEKDFKTEEMILDDFLKLPRKAQLVYFNQLGNVKQYMFTEFVDIDTSSCKSPIEQIFQVAFECIYWMANQHKIDFELPIILQLEPQSEIIIDGKRYIVDFLIENVESKYNFPPVVIECDGYEYHSSKEQINNDRERDIALKKSGYEVIRFTGTMIYENPYKCALDVFEFIKGKLVEVDDGKKKNV